MKIKTINKVAIFSVAAIALGAAATHGVINYFNGSVDDGSQIGIFASTGSAITDAIGSGVISQPESPIRSTPHLFPRIDVEFALPTPSSIKAGDYIEFSTENLALYNLNGREIRDSATDLIIGNVKRISVDEKRLRAISGDSSSQSFQTLRPEDSGTDEVYRLIFTENISKFENNYKVLLDSVNQYHNTTPANRDYSMTAKINYGGKTIAQTQYTVLASTQHEKLDTYYGNIYPKTEDGENIDAGATNVWLVDYIQANERIKAGDIVRYEISPNQGIAFDIDDRLGKKSEVCNNDAKGAPNQYGAYHINNQNCIEVEIIEASPTTAVFKILSAPTSSGFAGVLDYVKFKLLDTSPNTIDYDNQKIKPQEFTKQIIRNNEAIYSQTFKQGADISGATLKAYGTITKRGSIIRKIEDSQGNKIPGFESDKLMYERMKEGTPYDVSAPTIPGYTFTRLGEGSAPQKGSITEGTHNVTLIYTLNTQDISVPLGGTPNPKDHIPDFDKLFPGCEVKYKETPDTSRPGTIDAAIIISCPDQPDQEHNVKIHVGDPEVIPQTIKVGEIPDASKHIPNFEELFPGCVAKYKDQPDTSKPGKIDVTILVECEDGKTYKFNSYLEILGEDSKTTNNTTAPHTGFERARNAALATFAGLSTFAVLGSIFFKKRS